MQLNARGRIQNARVLKAWEVGRTDLDNNVQ